MLRIIILFTLALLLLIGPAAAQESPAIWVADAWVRATAAPMADAPAGGHGGHAAPAATEEPADHSAMGGVSAAYLRITNPGDQPISLTAATTSAADVVEIHETQMEGDVMRMRPVEGIVVAPGETVALQPGGLHIMLLDLTAPLAPGEAITLTLIFTLLDPDGAPVDEPLALVLGVPVLDEAPAPSAIIAGGVWARPTVAAHDGHASMGSTVSAVYMTLRAVGEAADVLVAATTPAADIVEIHETQMEGDVMRMRPVEDGIVVPSDGLAVLQPGGLHIMLLDLTAPLAPGDAFPLTLIFESGAEVIIGVPVYDAMGGMAGHGGG